MRIVLCAALVAMVFTVAGAARASVPGMISYQGKLTNTAGIPVPDGAYPVEFRLYPVSTEGAPFWTSPEVSVTTSGGVFTTLLGPLSPPDLAGRAEVWLETWVGSKLAPLSPRVRLTSVPYALVSGDSWSLLGNAATTAGTSFVGTTDSQPLELKVNNTRALRLEPTTATPNVVGGHPDNTTGLGVVGAVIAGGGYPGLPNSVSRSLGTIGGGHGNTVSGQNASIGGGLSNIASDYYATVAGGRSNKSGGFGSAIAGGGYNTIGEGNHSTIGGGFKNAASDHYATVPGGSENSALNANTFAAGQRAQALFRGSFVWSDTSTIAPNFFADTSQNQFLIKASGGVGIGANDPAAPLDVNGVIRSRSGGFKFPDGTVQATAVAPSWTLTGNAGTVPGTNFVGTRDSQPLEFRVNNVSGLRLEPTSDTPNLVGGFAGNTVASSAHGATIAGGGSAGYINSVAASFASVGGGYGNTASGYSAIVGAGDGNTASGSSAVVGGGQVNTAGGTYATIGGGLNNRASGSSATVPGGAYNTASGAYSFAAGYGATAQHDGSFVWADTVSTGFNFASTRKNQFLIRAISGVGIGTNDPQYQLHVNGGVAGVGAYVNLSDLRYKTNVATIANALDKVKKLRGVSFDWNRSRFPEVVFPDGPQLGLVAQEVKGVLPQVVSKDSKGIYSVAYGSVVPVLVEAMKEQEARLDTLERENGSLRKQIGDLRELVRELAGKEREKP